MGWGMKLQLQPWVQCATRADASMPQGSATQRQPAFPNSLQPEFHHRQAEVRQREQPGRQAGSSLPGRDGGGSPAAAPAGEQRAVWPSSLSLPFCCMLGGVAVGQGDNTSALTVRAAYPIHTPFLALHKVPLHPAPRSPSAPWSPARRPLCGPWCRAPSRGPRASRCKSTLRWVLA